MQPPTTTSSPGLRKNQVISDDDDVNKKMAARFASTWVASRLPKPISRKEREQRLLIQGKGKLQVIYEEYDEEDEDSQIIIIEEDDAEEEEENGGVVSKVKEKEEDEGRSLRESKLELDGQDVLEWNEEEVRRFEEWYDSMYYNSD